MLYQKRKRCSIYCSVCCIWAKNYSFRSKHFAKLSGANPSFFEFLIHILVIFLFSIWSLLQSKSKRYQQINTSFFLSFFFFLLKNQFGFFIRNQIQIKFIFWNSQYSTSFYVRTSVSYMYGRRFEYTYLFWNEIGN